MTKKHNSPPEFDPDDLEYDEVDFDDFDFISNQYDAASFWQEPDFLLADIVHLLVNLAGLEIGVTLFVKGMTLTGILTSERSYLQDLSDTFRKRVQVKDKRMSQTERDELNAMFDFTRLSESTVAQELDEEGVPIPAGTSPIRFVHLKNPMWIGPEGVMDFGHGSSPYIRLRLTLIDGWMLGELITSDMMMGEDSDEVLH